MADEERIKQQHYLSEEKVTSKFHLNLIKSESNIHLAKRTTERLPRNHVPVYNQQYHQEEML